MLKRAAVVNVSHPHYNLGAAKLANWLIAEGYEVESFGGDPGMFITGFDLICLSVIFTWDAPIAREIALDALEKQPKVRHDWTAEKLRDFARYYNRYIWRKTKIEDYMPRKFEANPFAAMILS